MVMLTPMLETLAERYGSPCNVVTSGHWGRSLYDGLPWVGRIEMIRSRKTPYLLDPRQQALVSRLRSQRDVPVWMMDTVAKVHWLIQRGGFDSSTMVSATDHQRRRGEHVVEHALRLAHIDPPAFQSATRPRVATRRPRLRVTNEEIEDCRCWCRAVGVDPTDVIVVHPGNKRTMRGGWRRRPSNVKYWPERRWAEVIESVRRLEDSSIVINATPREITLAQDIRNELSAPARAATVVGALPLRRLLALLAIGRGCISTDSGPAHAAAALDCPTLVLFGATDPRVYRPIGAAGSVRLVFSSQHGPVISDDGSEWYAGATMSAIPASLVVDAWTDLMDATTSDSLPSNAMTVMR